MAILPEADEWTPGIYQYEEEDVLQGGPDGMDNVQGKALANRTLWLKNQIANLSTGKQPLDAELTALAALVSAANTLPYFTGAGAAALTTLSAFARTLLDDADAAAARATIGANDASNLTTGTIPAARVPTLNQSTTGNAATATKLATARTINGVPFDGTANITISSTDASKQPLDDELTALAALVSAANTLPYFTGAGAAALTPLSPFARTLLDDANAAAALATLGAAPLVNAALGGTPTVPTAAAGTNTTQIASTEFVQAARGASAPVRQTVLTGPCDGNGWPSFLPATSANLSISTQNVGVDSAALIVGSASGFSIDGAVDRLGITTENLTWALTANATNYLYVDVSADGTLVPGSTTIPPIYTNSNAPAATNGQATFCIKLMRMFVGNGAAPVKANRVFVGEAVTSAGAVTSAIAYAYNGIYDSGFYAVAAASSYNKNHNLGVLPLSASQLVAQNADGSGWLVYMGVQGNSTGINQGASIISASRVSMMLKTGPNYVACFTNAAGNQSYEPSGYARQLISRGW
ncbi:hypothetical protein [Azonexus sp. R2A61]|uniref:hypothetical protein n=1 Tax=Azonexus sp. R2A61 TaxID=2744443 RepID=UPI001F304025|nr:hypothetical protein [Azonexus sp. R2A61]